MIYTDPDPVLYDHLGDILFSLKNYDEAKGAWKNSRSLTLHKKGDLGGEMPNPQTLQEKIERAKKLIQQSYYPFKAKAMLGSHNYISNKKSFSFCA